MLKLVYVLATININKYQSRCDSLQIPFTAARDVSDCSDTKLHFTIEDLRWGGDLGKWLREKDMMKERQR